MVVMLFGILCTYCVHDLIFASMRNVRRTNWFNSVGDRRTLGRPVQRVCGGRHDGARQSMGCGNWHVSTGFPPATARDEWRGLTTRSQATAGESPHRKIQRLLLYVTVRQPPVKQGGLHLLHTPRRNLKVIMTTQDPKKENL